MDAMGWTRRADRVLTQTPDGWGGVWSLLFTAERATGALCQVVPAAWAMSLYEVGEQLRGACDDLAVTHPGDVAAAPATDLGPVLSAADLPAALEVLSRLLAEAIVRAGALHTRQNAFPGDEAAAEAVQAWHKLLAGVDAHVDTLLAVQVRSGALRTSTAAADAAMRMLDGLGDLPVPHLTPRPSPGPVAAAWTRAALYVRTASDQFAVKPPEVISAAQALRRIATLTEVALAVEPVLNARAWDAGLSHSTLRRWTPGLEPDRAWAHTLAGMGDQDLCTATHGWVPAIDQDPAVRLCDDLDGLRRAAATLTVQPDEAVASLRDLAAVGAAVHHHTSLAVGVDPDHGTHPAAVRAQAWRALRDDLATYTSPGTPDPQLHADALAVRHQLAWLVPESHPAGWPLPRTRTLRTLATAGTVSADLADTSRHVFNHLVEDQQLTQPGKRHLDTAILATQDRYQQLAQPPTRALEPLTAAPQADQVRVLTRGATS